MKPLKNFPAMLTKHEVQRFLSYLYPVHKPDKMLALFRALRIHKKKELNRSEKKIIQSEISRMGIKIGGIKMLHHRLQKIIIDFLLSDAFLNNHPILERLHSAQIDIKRKWAQHYILKYTGRTGGIADSLIENAIIMAKKFECYADLIQLLQSKRFDRGYRFGEKEINKLTAEIKYYEKCEKAVRRATELYYRLIIYKKFHANPIDESMNRFLKRAVLLLKKLYKETRSAEVHYFLKYMEMECYEREKRFLSAKKTCIELIEIIADNPSISTRPRIDYAIANLAQYHVFLGEYNDALKTLNDLKFIITQPRDWVEAKEMILRILFYQKKYKEAEILFEKILKNLPEDAEPIRIGRLTFYRACISYMLKNEFETQKILDRKLFIRKDKTGWGVSARMLELMLLTNARNRNKCCVEAKRLKKFLANKNSIVSKRDFAMSDFFLLFAQNDFSLKKINPRVNKIYKFLNYGKGEYSWNPLGYEIIRYDLWINKFLHNKIN